MLILQIFDHTKYPKIYKFLLILKFFELFYYFYELKSFQLYIIMIDHIMK